MEIKRQITSFILVNFVPQVERIMSFVSEQGCGGPLINVPEAAQTGKLRLRKKTFQLFQLSVEKPNLAKCEFCLI